MRTRTWLAFRVGRSSEGQVLAVHLRGYGPDLVRRVPIRTARGHMGGRPAGRRVPEVFGMSSPTCARIRAVGLRRVV